MNPIKRLFLGLPDDELRAAVAELKVLDDTGVMPQGSIAALSTRVRETVGITASDARSVVMSEVIRQAAFRWAGVAEQLEGTDVE
jgi:hypothetical protein